MCKFIEKYGFKNSRWESSFDIQKEKNSMEICWQLLRADMVVVGVFIVKCQPFLSDRIDLVESNN